MFYGGLRHLNEPILCIFESHYFIEIFYGCPYKIAAIEKIQIVGKINLKQLICCQLISCNCQASFRCTLDCRLFKSLDNILAYNQWLAEFERADHLIKQRVTNHKFINTNIWPWK